MDELKHIKKIYFIGIGGIGMSALARYFKFHGKQVSGYDKTETPLTKQLITEGIPIHYTENIDLAPKDVQWIVYTPAVPADHKELLYYRENNYTILKRSDVLGVITNSSFNICVSGTHGKTTVSTMIAHLLRDSGYGCNAFLGGISVNYNSNFWSSEKNTCVIEADEYDRSFLKLSPDIAVITAMDADHLDIYGTAEAVEDAFIAFSGKVKPGGLLLAKQGLSRTKDLQAPSRMSYSLDDSNADIYTKNIGISGGSYSFDVVSKDWSLEQVHLNMGGLHNIENAVVSIAVARRLGIHDEKIKKAIASFRGVKRRFEYVLAPVAVGEKDRPVFIDDYAHHPEELRALISSAKNLFPEKKCTVIFQPHLFTRTRDFADGFAESLDLADEVILLPIYPARELPIAGVTSKIIADKMKKAKVILMNKDEVLKLLKDETKSEAGREFLITAGAGDIDTLVQPIKEIFEKTN
ncbi:MAG: UDP-N-acetylmuramate--L-alanine ligase [Bacteroidetes bacterium]|nr:UDP-N-acetylmuramate--L-alanine ligase [Bacteroidota bacterium]